MGNDSCEVNCNEDNILAVTEKEDRNETASHLEIIDSPSTEQWVYTLLNYILFFSFIAL